MDNPERVRISRKVKASIREAEKNDTAEQKTLCKARPIVKTQKSNITRNYETEQPSQADVFDDSTDIPVTRPSALDTAADEKPRRIGRETKATIREDSADTHVTHPSALDTAGSEKPRRIVRETGTVSRDNNTDVSVAHPSALDTADVKPRRISRVSRTSILKDNADVPVTHPSAMDTTTDEKPKRIVRDTRTSFFKDNADTPVTPLSGDNSQEPTENQSDISIGSNIEKPKPIIRQQKRTVRTAENVKKKDAEKLPTTGQKLKDTAAKSAVSVAKNVAAAPIKAHKIAADKALEQGKQSTGFDNGSSASPNAQAAGIIAAGIKKTADPQNIVTAARRIQTAPGKVKRNITGIRRSAQGTKKAAKETARSAAGIKAAITNFQKAQYINSLVNQSGRQAALNSAKNAGELAFNVAKSFVEMVLNAIRTVADGSAMVYLILAALAVLVVVIFAIGSFIFSGYGIFFSSEADNPMKIEEIVRNVNTDYQKKIEDKTKEYDRSSVSLVRYEGSKMQWKYIIALYAVKYSSDGEDIITVDKKTKERLSKLFYDIHSISAKYVTEPNPHASTAQTIFVDPDWEVLVVTTAAKELSQIMDDMKFTDEQKDQVMNLVNNDTDELWNKILYGHNGNGGQALANIAKGQIGQPPQTYTAWTGTPNGMGNEWSGSFVCWCANEAGYVIQGLYPRSNDKVAIMDWFNNRGLWENPDQQPNVGDTIFLSEKGDDVCTSCGIISKIEDGKVYYITNEEDIVAELNTRLSNDYNSIIGYGVLPQMSGLRGDTVEEKIFNYLRQKGYSAVSACAVLGNIQDSCGCDPEVFAKEHGYYTGLFHWNGTEMTEFMDWCSSNAYDWRNLESQLMFYEHWVDEREKKGCWGSQSTRYHLNIQAVGSTAAFKSITANDYEGDTAKAIYEATVMFTDDIARTNYLSNDEAKRYSYAAEFYNYLVANTVDGSTQRAWRPECAAEIGVFHLY